MNVRFLYILFSIVWANDTGAYFGGKFVSKMQNVWRFPDYINRKKTFLGSLTGIALGTTIGIYVFDTSLSTSLILSVASQVGDMLESRAKRLADMKDSNLNGFEIAGHGGILDRIDALIFATPFAFVLFRMH
jgi:phosphatidate cytidylyltransferase